MKRSIFFARRRRGQGMTEYVVIVGLIAIALITAVVKFKNALGNAFEKSAGAVDNISKQIDKSAQAISGQ